MLIKDARDENGDGTVNPRDRNGNASNLGGRYSRHACVCDCVSDGVVVVVGVVVESDGRRREGKGGHGGDGDGNEKQQKKSTQIT